MVDIVQRDEFVVKNVMFLDQREIQSMIKKRDSEKYNETVYTCLLV